MKSPHRLILASAGTGKTYQLTGQFLALLMGGVEPQRILATTFTRKAAGEILDRVLRRLVDGATDDGARAELNAQLGTSFSAEQYQERLVELARGLDRFRIRTLDAFFVQLGRLFALDLGLPADWSIVDEVEDKRIRREAIARALDGADRASIVELLRNLQKADASRSIEYVLLAAVNDGRDAFLESDPEAWELIRPPAGLNEEQLAETLAAIEGMELPTTKAGAPVKHWVNARDEMLARASRSRWEALFEVGFVGKVLRGETDFARHLITKEVRGIVEPLVRHAAHVLIADLVRQNIATRDWLERFETAYGSTKRDERAYRFEDIPKALAPASGEAVEESELWYRLDARIDHLLLDEFQDTAPAQWRILERLASECLADGTGERSFFCVGDVKQSIYGWREAEPRLLSQMAQRYPVLDPPEHLVKSYRSSHLVLDTVNRAFADLATSPALRDRPVHQDAARGWSEGYEAHESAKELPGAAWLVEAPEVEDSDEAELSVLRLAAERAAKMAHEAPRATIGILLRRNKHIARLIYLLRQSGVLASGEGGNPLTDSSAVLHFVSVLHLADHPSDSAAAFHVASSPLGAALGLKVSSSRDEVRDVSRSIRRRLLEEGYGGFCTQLLETVRESAAYGAWDRKRFDQLVDLAHAFDHRAGLRPGALVDYIRDTQVEDPSATRVKVMTVHAAKGLEFDAVVLPELDEPFSAREPRFLTYRPDPAGRLEAVSNARKRDICDLDPEGLGVLRTEQDDRDFREALCILYVAMTRAVHRLDMIVQHRKRRDVPRSYSGLLKNAFGAGMPDEEGVLWRHEDNAEPWYTPELAEESSGSELTERAVPSFKPSTGPRAMPRKSPSGEEGDGSVFVEHLLRSQHAAARTRGSLIHRWLEEIEWLEDFEATDEDLLELGATIEPDAEERRRRLEDFRRLLESPATRALLGREQQKNASAELRVERERAFSVVAPDATGAECLWTGAMDRVVVHEVDGVAVRAEVIDYKTDAVEGDRLDARVDFYRPQIEVYRRVCARMTGLEEEQVACRLLFLAAGELRDV